MASPFGGLCPRKELLKRTAIYYSAAASILSAILELGIRCWRQKGNRIAERMMEKVSGPDVWSLRLHSL